MVFRDAHHLIAASLVLVEVHGRVVELKVLEFSTVPWSDVLLVLRCGANVVRVISGTLDLM